MITALVALALFSVASAQTIYNGGRYYTTGGSNLVPGGDAYRYQTLGGSNLVPGGNAYRYQTLGGTGGLARIALIGSQGLSSGQQGGSRIFRVSGGSGLSGGLVGRLAGAGTGETRTIIRTVAQPVGRTFIGSLGGQTIGASGIRTAGVSQLTTGGALATPLRGTLVSGSTDVIGVTEQPSYFTTTRYGPITSGGLEGSGDRSTSLTFNRVGTASGALFSTDTAEANENARKSRGYEYRYRCGEQ